VKQFREAAGLCQKIDKNTSHSVKALKERLPRSIVCTLQKFSWMRTSSAGPKD